MRTFETLPCEKWQDNPFTTIDKDWLLVTASYEGKTNTMTASWGSVGILWGEKVASIYIRPQRFTNTLLEKAPTFSLTVLPEKFRKELNYLGTASGRDEDKIAKAGLTIRTKDGIPYFDEGRLVLLCDKLYAQPFEEKFFVEKEVAEKVYPEKDFHILYVGRIREMLKAE